jgi:very-short-patch-repair endonuclease
MDQNPHGLRTHHAADARIARVALRQHGVYSREQAMEVGFTRGMIDYRLTSGRWAVVDSGVYRSAATPPAWEQRLIAACLGGPAVASHRAAGLLWAFPEMPAEIIEVTALRHRRRRAGDVTWHESYHLTHREVTELNGIPVTRPFRTFIDLAVVLPSSRLEEVLDNGLRRQLFDMRSIWRRLDELGDLRPGATRARDVLMSRVGGERPSESVLETRFHQLVRDAGLPMPSPQFTIRTNGEAIARVDFAYPELNLAIELDGAAYHSSERARRQDRSRENRLVAIGWRVLRFTWEDVHDQPTSVLSALRCVHRP